MEQKVFHQQNQKEPEESRFSHLFDKKGKNSSTKKEKFLSKSTNPAKTLYFLGPSNEILDVRLDRLGPSLCPIRPKLMGQGGHTQAYLLCRLLGRGRELGHVDHHRDYRYYFCESSYFKDRYSVDFRQI
jgi:hypothetical protein